MADQDERLPQLQGTDGGVKGRHMLFQRVLGIRWHWRSTEPEDVDGNHTVTR
jgi:hypothetical protein